MTKKVLIVGAGFAGAVHARELADAGVKVDVIDRRLHIGGNAYEEKIDGSLIHKYGPHLFHTSNLKVVEWLSQFTDWTPYEHRVKARLPDGSYAPLPINLTTLRIVSREEIHTSEDAVGYLAKVKRLGSSANAREWLESQIGSDLTDLFYTRYTKKMWNMDLEKIDVSVVNRLKIRLSEDDRYFPDDIFQAMPAAGYNALFDKILDDKNITVHIGVDFFPALISGYDLCFNSMSIDEFFDYRFGELPYRSIRFHHRCLRLEECEPFATINFTDEDIYTRETRWAHIPTCGGGVVSVATKEEPCDYKDNNMERYYPLSVKDNELITRIRKYKQEAETLTRMQFIGRCGLYQYLDMHQVINQSLQSVKKWISDNM